MRIRTSHARCWRWAASRAPSHARSRSLVHRPTCVPRSRPRSRRSRTAASRSSCASCRRQTRCYRVARARPARPRPRTNRARYRAARRHSSRAGPPTTSSTSRLAASYRCRYRYRRRRRHSRLFVQTDTVAPSSPPPPRGAFLGVYGLYGPNAYGIRGELDLYRHGSLRHSAPWSPACTTRTTPLSPMTSPEASWSTARWRPQISICSATRRTSGIRPRRGHPRHARRRAALVQVTLEPIFTGADITWEGMLENNVTGMTALPLADASIPRSTPTSGTGSRSSPA